MGDRPVPLSVPRGTWVVLSDDGTPLKSFPAGRTGYQQAVRWSLAEGGEYDIVFVAHGRPEW